MLCPDWKDKIIGITTDGENKMTGNIKGKFKLYSCNINNININTYLGIATLFEKSACPGFYRVWCGSHQLDLTMQTCYTSILTFQSELTPLIKFLRKQYNLITEMNTKSPLVSL